MKIAYVTDSGTGRSIEYFASKGVHSLPLQIACEDKTYQDTIDIDYKTTIRLMREKKVLKTSLPSLGKIDDLFNEFKKDNVDLVIAVPICKGLSGTINALEITARQYDIDIICIDTYVTAVVEEYLILRIKECIENNVSKEEIKKLVDDIIDSANTLIAPFDLSTLKRGGRLKPAAALLANLLKIVPVLKINKETEGKIDVLDKVRTHKKALLTLLNQMKNDHVDETYLVTIAHVDALDRAKELEVMMNETFENLRIQIIELCNPVSAQTGPDCVCIQYFKTL